MVVYSLQMANKLTCLSPVIATGRPWDLVSEDFNGKDARG